MKGQLLIVPRRAKGPSLRSIQPEDNDYLRVWKNANVAGFFFKGQIAPEMQKQWYEGYLARDNDFMFMVMHEGRRAGCMGFRLKDGGHADTYNMIADPGHRGTGVMKDAMLLMCSYIAAKHTKDIGCLVLLSNPAIGYYVRCGYRVTGEGKDHHILSLDWSKFKPVEFDVPEPA